MEIARLVRAFLREFDARLCDWGPTPGYRQPSSASVPSIHPRVVPSRWGGAERDFSIPVYTVDVLFPQRNGPVDVFLCCARGSLQHPFPRSVLFRPLDRTHGWRVKGNEFSSQQPSLIVSFPLPPNERWVRALRFKTVVRGGVGITGDREGTEKRESIGKEK